MGGLQRTNDDDDEKASLGNHTASERAGSIGQRRSRRLKYSSTQMKLKKLARAAQPPMRNVAANEQPRHPDLCRSARHSLFQHTISTVVAGDASRKKPGLTPMGALHTPGKQLHISSSVVNSLIGLATMLVSPLAPFQTVQRRQSRQREMKVSVVSMRMSMPTCGVYFHSPKIPSQFSLKNENENITRKASWHRTYPIPRVQHSLKSMTFTHHPFALQA